MIKGKVKRKVYYLVCDCLSVLNRVMPKNNGKLLFFSSSDFTDNTRALFEYAYSNGIADKYSIVVSCDAYEKYSRKYDGVYFTSKISALWHMLTSRYVFFHTEIFAVKPCKRQLFINLWHGTPIKRFNKMADKLSDYRYDFFTYLLAASELFVPIMARSFGCDISKVVILGHPRNDFLFKRSDTARKLISKGGSYWRSVIWLPTFRISRDNYVVDVSEEYISDTGLPICGSKAEMLRLNKFAQENAMQIIIKLHPAQNLDFIDFTQFCNLMILTDEDLFRLDINLYSMLQYTDALITDYSSIFFDYLLLDKPIGFTIDDIESYGANRGFVFEDPLSYMPGEKITDIDGLLAFLSDVAAGHDDFAFERARICDIANHYKDNHNCRRVFELAGIDVVK